MNYTVLGWLNPLQYCFSIINCPAQVPSALARLNCSFNILCSASYPLFCQHFSIPFSISVRRSNTHHHPPISVLLPSNGLLPWLGTSESLSSHSWRGIAPLHCILCSSITSSTPCVHPALHIRHSFFLSGASLFPPNLL